MFVNIKVDPSELTADTIDPAEVLTAKGKKGLLKVAKMLGVFHESHHSVELLVLNILAHLEAHPEYLLCAIPRTEYPLLIELFDAKPTQYVERPYRKISYLLMRLGLIPAAEDNQRRVWKLIMPTKLKKIIGKDLPYFIDLYDDEEPFPTAEEYRYYIKPYNKAVEKAKKLANVNVPYSARPFGGS